MDARDYTELLARKWDENKFLCIGLDPDISKIPQQYHKTNTEETLFAFNKYIIDEVSDFVCSYKPNSAFYEQYGTEGLSALKKTIKYLHETHSDIPVILDAKRADIGNTNNGYVTFAFEYLEADGLTVHPYMGGESLTEFFDNRHKGIFVMCRNSNPGAGEFQDLVIDGEPLYIHLAKAFAEKWNHNGNCTLVAGATFPEELQRVRSAVPNMPFLIPGIGAQGGDLEQSVKYGKDANNRGFTVSTSRVVIYADSPQAKAKELHGAIVKSL
jgi:orotidine-5'-phosphate decarboxylase